MGHRGGSRPPALLLAAALSTASGCTHLCQVPDPVLPPRAPLARPAPLSIEVSADPGGKAGTWTIDWSSGHHWLVPVGAAVEKAFAQVAVRLAGGPVASEPGPGVAGPPDALLQVQVLDYRAWPAGFPGSRAEIDVRASLQARGGEELARFVATGHSPADVPWEINTCAAMGQAAAGAIANAAAQIGDAMARSYPVARWAVPPALQPDSDGVAAGAEAALPRPGNPMQEPLPDTAPLAAMEGEPDWSVTFQVALGYGGERISPRLPVDGGAVGFGLLLRYRGFSAGPFLDAALADARDSVYFGGAAGAVLHPRPWARVELLAEAGQHVISVESDYAGEPAGRASLPFLGLRAGLYAFGHDLPMRHPQLFFARRVGVGLKVGLRTDLGRRSVARAFPAELGRPPEILDVGGHSVTATLVLPLEW